MRAIQNVKQAYKYILHLGLLLSGTISNGQTHKEAEYAMILNEGIELFRANNNIAAHRKFEAAYKLDSLNFNSLLYLGWSELELKNYGKAMQLINKAIMVDSGKNDEFTYYVRGLIYYESGKYKESGNDLNKAVTASPEDAILAVLMARSQLAGKDYPSAFATINRSLELSDQSYTPFYYRGICQREFGHIREAIADFEKALGFEDKEPDAHYSLGELYRQLGNFEKAGKNFELYSLLGQNAVRVKESIINAGICYYFSGSYFKSIEKLERGMKLYPEFREGHTYLGMGFLATGDTAKSRYNLEKALQLNPHSALALHYLGKMEYFLKENGTARGLGLIQQSEKYAAAQKNGILLFDLSQTYLLMGDTSKALDLVAQTLAILPEYVPALQYRIRINQARVAEEKELMADHDRLIEIHKNNPKARAYYLAYKAVSLSGLQLYAKGVKSLDEAIRTNDFSEYYILRAYLQLRQFTAIDSLSRKSAAGIALRSKVLQDIEKGLASGHRKKDALMMKAAVLIALDEYKEACKVANESVKLGKKISPTHLNQLCADTVKFIGQWDVDYNLTPYEESSF